MSLRQRFCFHQWIHGYTAMEEETAACEHCHLTFDAWYARQPSPLLRAFRWIALLSGSAAGLSAYLIHLEPWHAIGFCLSTALACALLASFFTDF